MKNVFKVIILSILCIFLFNVKIVFADEINSYAKDFFSGVDETNYVHLSLDDIENGTNKITLNLNDGYYISSNTSVYYNGLSYNVKDSNKIEIEATKRGVTALFVSVTNSSDNTNYYMPIFIEVDKDDLFNDLNNIQSGKSYTFSEALSLIPFINGIDMIEYDNIDNKYSYLKIENSSCSNNNCTITYKYYNPTMENIDNYESIIYSYKQISSDVNIFDYFDNINDSFVDLNNNETFTLTLKSNHVNHYEIYDSQLTGCTVDGNNVILTPGKNYSIKQFQITLGKKYSVGDVNKYSYYYAIFYLGLNYIDYLNKIVNGISNKYNSVNDISNNINKFLDGSVSINTVCNDCYVNGILQDSGNVNITFSVYANSNSNVIYSTSKNISIVSNNKELPYLYLKKGDNSELYLSYIKNFDIQDYFFVSADNSIATIDAKGRIKGINKGTTKVYVYSKNSFNYYTTNVIVKNEDNVIDYLNSLDEDIYVDIGKSSDYYLDFSNQSVLISRLFQYIINNISSNYNLPYRNMNCIQNSCSFEVYDNDIFEYQEYTFNVYPTGAKITNFKLCDVNNNCSIASENDLNLNNTYEVNYVNYLDSDDLEIVVDSEYITLNDNKITLIKEGTTTIKLISDEEDYEYEKEIVIRSNDTSDYFETINYLESLESIDVPFNKSVFNNSNKDALKYIINTIMYSSLPNNDIKDDIDIDSITILFDKAIISLYIPYVGSSISHKVLNLNINYTGQYIDQVINEFDNINSNISDNYSLNLSDTLNLEKSCEGNINCFYNGLLNKFVNVNSNILDVEITSVQRNSISQYINGGQTYKIVFKYNELKIYEREFVIYTDHVIDMNYNLNNTLENKKTYLKNYIDNLLNVDSTINNISNNEFTVNIDDYSFNVILDKKENTNISQLEVSKYVVVVNTGENYKIDFTYYPKYAIKTNVTFSSKDSNIASVDSNGNITGVSKGTTYIILKTGTITQKVLVFVNESPVEYLNSELKKISSNVIVNYADLKYYDITDEDEYMNLISNSVSRSYGYNNIYHQVVKDENDYYLYLKFYNSNYVSSDRLKLSISFEGIQIENETYELEIGESITPLITYTNGSKSDLRFTVNRNSAVTVSNDGVVTAVNEGKAYVYIEDIHNNYWNYFEVYVNYDHFKENLLNTFENEVLVANPYYYTDCDSEDSWCTDNYKIIGALENSLSSYLSDNYSLGLYDLFDNISTSIDGNKFIVKAIDEYDNQKKSFSFNFIEKGIKIDDYVINLNVGDTQELTFTEKNLDDETIISINDSTICSLNNNNTITALKAGTCEITFKNGDYVNYMIAVIDEDDLIEQANEAFEELDGQSVNIYFDSYDENLMCEDGEVKWEYESQFYNSITKYVKDYVELNKNRFNYGLSGDLTNYYFKGIDYTFDINYEDGTIILKPQYIYSFGNIYYAIDSDDYEEYTMYINYKGPATEENEIINKIKEKTESSDWLVYKLSMEEILRYKMDNQSKPLYYYTDYLDEIKSEYGITKFIIDGGLGDSTDGYVMEGHDFYAFKNDIYLGTFRIKFEAILDINLESNQTSDDIEEILIDEAKEAYSNLMQDDPREISQVRTIDYLFTNSLFKISDNSDVDVNVTKEFSPTLNAVLYKIDINDISFSTRVNVNYTENEEYNINKTISNGSLNVDSKTNAGENVSFSLSINKGYKLKSIVITNSDGVNVTNEVNYNSTTHSFTMPAYDVKIVVNTISLKLSTPKASVSKGSNNSLIINFNKQDAADKYYIYRSTDKRNYSKIATVTTNTYTDKSLTYGRTYYYKVIAYNSYNGKTKYSNVVYKKVVPNKVVNLKTSSIKNNSIKLSFDKVSGSGYEVYRSTNNKSWSYVSRITKSSTTSYKNKKLKPNTTYYYKVRAYKTVSGRRIYGSYSSVLKVKTAPDTGKLSVSLKDYNALNIKTYAIKGAVKYQIYKSSDKTTFNKLNEGNYGTYTDYDVVLGKTYYYKVRACNSSNVCGPFSSISSLKVTPKTPSISLSTSSKKVTIKTSSINADGYEVYSSTSKNGKYSKVGNINLESLSLINSTKKGYTYYYKIRSYKIVSNKYIYSPYSSIKSIKSK